MTSVAVMGAAGYIGGEVLRLVLGHPELELVGASSRSRQGRPVHASHPNLRGLTDLDFVHPDDLPAAEVLFTALPHGEISRRAGSLLERDHLLIDLSSDFRIADEMLYRQFYPHRHPGPVVGEFVPGIPELHRERLRTAKRISVAGCMATAAILSLHPLAEEKLVEGDVEVDGRPGSSGSGVAAGTSNLHAERSGAFRVFAPMDHRHAAEVRQATGLPARMSATGVEAVRGVQVLCRARLREGVDERDVRCSYRHHYEKEPFVRIVAQRSGSHRLPDPKILSGSNYCDVGFAVRDREVLAIGALDNLVKGGAGAAVQSLNIRMGWPETAGLGFPGLHP
jgi:N-acetyl-gamma-glutamyl-phosphate/LysW-gamma-L-alpha-aminoadipyl-6-phosphate reductase